MSFYLCDKPLRFYLHYTISSNVFSFDIFLITMFFLVKLNIKHRLGYMLHLITALGLITEYRANF